jgi:two-component system, NtrC family, sensor kinase
MSIHSILKNDTLSKTILDQVNIGVYLLDLQGKFAYVNPALADMVEYPMEEMIGRSPLDAIPLSEKEKIFRSLKERLDGRQDKASYITKLICRTGREIDISIDTTNLYDKDGKNVGILGFARDITQSQEIKKQRQWLESQAFMIEKLTVLGRLATTVVHQINNPLEAMKNYLYLLKTEFPEQDSKRVMIETIEGEIFRIARLTHHLVQFAIPSSTEYASFDLLHLLEETLFVMDKKIRNCQVFVETNLPPTLPLMRGLPDQLRQAFINLIFNALEAMENGGSLTITVDQRESDVEIRFHDTGIGIRREDVSRIFDPFFTTKDPNQSFGLGLSVTLKIIHNHGGTITVESEAMRGSCFIVSLPVPA